MREEIERRIRGLREGLRQRGLEALLVFSPINLFYLTGLWFKGFLLITPHEANLYFRRPPLRGLKDSPFSFFPLESLKRLPEILRKHSLRRIGLEYRAFNLYEGERLKGLLSDFEIEPADELLWSLRMIKSSYEIECLKESARMLSKALRRALLYFRPGMSELSASAVVESHLRELGHPGLTRSANNFELTFGYLISGKEGLFSTPYTTGEGGKGVFGFPGGATTKKLKKGEPILLDFSGFSKGYYVDQTRMASLGQPSQGVDFFEAALQILKTLEKRVKPGISCEEVYLMGEEIAEKYGFQDYFMRHGEKMRFLGHGVGLEIDEPPVIAPKNREVLKENLVIALEPKFHVDDLGVIGLEDTFLVTKEGLKRITTFPRKWIIL